MKNILRILLVIVPVLLAGCDAFTSGGDAVISRSQRQNDLGEIYGYDATLCGCCGGYMIRINGKNYKFFNSDVGGSNPLNLIDIHYPASVRLSWSLKTGDCSDEHRIVVHSLQLVTKN